MGLPDLSRVVVCSGRRNVPATIVITTTHHTTTRLTRMSRPHKQSAAQWPGKHSCDSYLSAPLDRLSGSVVCPLSAVRCAFYIMVHECGSLHKSWPQSMRYALAWCNSVSSY